MIQESFQYREPSLTVGLVPRLAASLFLLTAFCLLPSAVRAQGTPGTVRCPTQADTLDSLFRIKDASRTVLAGVLTSSSTTIPVTSTATFPSSGSIKIDSEIIYYSSTTSTSFGTLVRGASGTAAAAHANSALVSSPILAAHHNTLAQAVICAETLAVGAIPGTRTVNGHPLSADVTVTPADLGLVIGTNVEAYNVDLLAIAGLSPANNDVIQRKAGSWTNRTMAQVKSDLALTQSDVGLSNVANVDTSNASNILSGTLNAARLPATYATAGEVGSSGLTMSTAKLLGRSTAGTGAIEEIIIGSGLTLSGGTLNASGGVALGDTPTWTGAHTWSKNGAASTPTVLLSGTWFTGGSSTTNKPQFLIEPAGTTSSGWSSSGTAQGINAPAGFVGYLADWQVNGISKFYVGGAGDVTVTRELRFETDNSQDFGRVASFRPRTGYFGTSVVTPTIKLTPVAFASLPGSPTEGMCAWVNDSNTATWGATAAGGGANHVGVCYNGSNWTVAAK